MESHKTTFRPSLRMVQGELAGVSSRRDSGLANASIGENELHSEGSYVQVSTVSSSTERNDLVPPGEALNAVDLNDFVNWGAAPSTSISVAELGSGNPFTPSGVQQHENIGDRARWRT
mmetsp:Transcript_16678/g.42418  ORF Transcript_16678/g.42418 Transcript_16678/m.42418 type:complete len:118 (-) Transcript_16678:27-380(-)